MKSFLLMVGFFTRLPVPQIEFTEERYRKAAKLLPLVGLAVGAILVLVSAIGLVTPPMIRGAVLACAYIILSGGLHFDGLADTCDGVFSGRSREQSLEIMKDSRIGVFGTLGIFMVGLLYFALLTAAPAPALLVFPVCGRACCLLSASLAPYARADGMGKATGLSGGPAAVISAIASLVCASFLTVPLLMLVSRFAAASGLAVPAVAVPAGSPMPSALPVGIFADNIFVAVVFCSLIAAAVSVFVTVRMTVRLKAKLGGVTGDTFGAVIEVSSIVYLLVSVIAYQVLTV
ncbi:MAG: adenosylcobinamide-GDP ribazoletransferase [Clostridiales Family XIII bacterium]|jgi:adenosylcobinamide-GDP ribazoletransferase|nr:adenosylcobinamide-GDP ribazoletransferase [Clostridiales Family XIII bacterium]